MLATGRHRSEGLAHVETAGSRLILPALQLDAGALEIRQVIDEPIAGHPDVRTRERMVCDHLLEERFRLIKPVVLDQLNRALVSFEPIDLSVRQRCAPECHE